MLSFLPTGTTERVCLISGTLEGILKIHEFIMEKIKEKPDPNAKMAIDFDHKQPAEREKQVGVQCPFVPQVLYDILIHPVIRVAACIASMYFVMTFNIGGLMECLPV